MTSNAIQRSAHDSEKAQDQSGKFIFVAIAGYGVASLIVLTFITLLSSVAFPAPIISLLSLVFLAVMVLVVTQLVYKNFAVSLLALVAVISTAYFIRSSWAVAAWCFVLCVAMALLRARLIKLIRTFCVQDFVAVVTAGCLLAVMPLLSWHDADIFTLWDLSHEAVNIDPMQHAAMTSMVKNYGIVSTGINGNIPLIYHAFSHFIRAAISLGTGIPVVSLYGILQVFFFEPLLILTMVAFAETFIPSGNVRIFLLRILALFVALCSIVMWPAFAQHGFWESYGTSDSYSLSLVFLMAMVCATKIPGIYIRYAVMVALLLLTTATKVSTGTVAVAILVAHLIFVDRGPSVSRMLESVVAMIGWALVLYFTAIRSRTDDIAGQLGSIALSNLSMLIIAVGAILLVILFVLLFYKSTRTPGVVLLSLIFIVGLTLCAWNPFNIPVLSAIELLHFPRAYGGITEQSGGIQFLSALGKFVLIQFLFTWICILFAGMCRHDRKCDNELFMAVMVCCIASVVPGFVVLAFAHLYGGAEYYFSNVAMFIALPFLIGLCFVPNGNDGLSVIASNLIPTVLLAVFAVILFLPNPGGGGDKLVSALRNKVRSERTDADGKLAQFVKYFEEIRRDPSTVDLAVYIGKDQGAFWGAKLQKCDVLPLLIPTVSERPGLFAHPNCGSVIPILSGYGDYFKGPSAALAQSARLAPDLLLGAARDAGFAGYIDLRDEGWTVHRVPLETRAP